MLTQIWSAHCRADGRQTGLYMVGWSPFMIAAVSVLLAVDFAVGGSVGVNIVGTAGSEGALNQGYVAGYVPQTNWNNMCSASAAETRTGITNSDGQVVSGLAVQTLNWNLGINRSSAANAGVAHTNMFEGVILKNSGGWQDNITVSNIPYEVYDVYVYLNSANGAYGGIRVNGGGETYYAYMQTYPLFTGYVKATSTVSTTTIFANMAVFTNIAATNIAVQYSRENFQVGCSGFQIVDRTEILRWTSSGTSNVTVTSAMAYATFRVLGGTNADVTFYCGTSNIGKTKAGWTVTNGIGSQSTGQVLNVAITNLSANTTYYYVFHGTNNTLNVEGWSAVGSFRCPGTDEWTGDANDLWGSIANWAGANVPDAAGESALFKDKGLGNVDLGGTNYAAGSVTLAGGGYTLIDSNGSPGSLTVSALTNSSGTNTIAVGVTIVGELDVSGGNLSVTATESFSADEIKLRGGTLAVQGAGEFTAGPGLWDFETADLSGWHDVGTVYGPNNLFSTPGEEPVNHGTRGGSIHGTWWIDCYDPQISGGSDGYTGILESDTFILGANCEFRLLVCGGNFAWSGDPDSPSANLAGVALERQVAPGDWANLFWATGGDNTFSERVWDASAYAGQTVRLRIYDTHTGGWGWTGVDYIRATAIIVGSAGPVDMTAIPIKVTGNATINALCGTNIAALGDLTVSNATLATSGNALTFASATVPSTATLAGFSPGVDTYLTDSTGLDGSGAAATIAKIGTGTLILDKAGINLDSASFNVQTGTLAAVNANAFGGASLVLNGGQLLLSSPGGNITYANNMSVTSNSTLTAGKAGSGVSGPLTNTVSGSITFAGMQSLTNRATDNYTLRLGGEIAGNGTNVLSLGSVIIDDPSFNAVSLIGGALTVYSNLTVNSLVQSSGTFSMAGASKDLTVSNTLTLAGALNFSGGPNLVLTTATVTLNSGANVTYDKALAASSVTVNSGGTLNLGNNALTAGTLTLNSGGTLSLGTNALNVGTGSWRNGATLNVTGPMTFSTSMSFWPERTITNTLSGAGDVNIGYNPEDSWGYVSLIATNAYTGITQIGRGILRAVEGAGLPTASRLVFNQDTSDEYGVFENSGTFTRNIGTGAGEVYWVNRGGFSARGGNLVVTLEGGASLDWSSATVGFNNSAAVQFGSPYADGMVELRNPVNLNNVQRNIQVCNNTGVKTDFLRLSGTISGTGGATSTQLRFNEGSNNGFYDSLVELTGTNTFTQRLLIDAAAVYAVDGKGFPAASQLYFEGNNDAYEAIFLSSGTFNRQIGNIASGVYWAERGGFAARGAPLTVTLEGGTNLTWGDANVGFQGRNLQMGSMYADNLVDLTNSIALGANRAIFVFDNTDTDQDVAKLSGVISGAFQLRKYGGDAHRGGTLWLSGANTFSGQTFIDEGAIRAIEGRGLPSVSQLYLEGDSADRPCVLESSGTFTRPINNAAGSNVYWGASGGFAAWGGPLAVNLEGSIELQFDSATIGFNNQRLHLGSRSADNVVNLQNAISLSANWRNISLFDNFYSTNDYAVLSGNIRNGYLRTYGDGIMKLTGTNSFTYLELNGTSTVMMNGLQSGMTWVYNAANNASTLGGSGIVSSTSMEIRNLGILAPGDGAGTLTTSIADANGLYMLGGSTYHWQLGPGVSDKVTQAGNLRLDSGWKLRLLSAGGTPRASDQYNLFTYTGSFSGTTTPSSIDAPGMPADWVTNNVQVLHDTTSSPKRVYITGLYSLLSVANDQPTDLTSTSATLNGVVSAQADPLYVSVYWSTNNGGTSTSAWLAAGFTASKGSFANVVGVSVSHAITGLNTNELWYYTFNATNSAGTINLWGIPAMSFSALGPPVVTNTGATGLSIGTVTLNGMFLNHNRAGITICWGTTDGGTSSPSAWEMSTNIGVQAGASFAGAATGLLYPLGYVYRIYASNDYGFAWSDPVTAFTASSRPGVPTPGITNGLALWLDAAATNTMTLAGSTVNEWRDKVGGIAKATTYSGAPTLLAGGIGGLPVVRFNTSARMNDGVNHVSPVTVLAVSRETGGSNGRVLGAGNNWLFGYYNGTRNDFHFDSWIYDSPTPSDTNAHLHAATIQGGGLNNTVYAEGVQLASNANGPNGPNSLQLNGYGNGNNEMSDCEFSEVLVYHRILASNELDTVGGYLEAKYGLSTAYPNLKYGPGIVNLQATNVTVTEGWMNSSLNCSGAVYDVWAYWGGTNQTTNAGSWGNSAFVGRFSNGMFAATWQATGLSGNTTNWYTFLASNALDQTWAAPSTNFVTVTTPAVNNSTGATVVVGQATLRGNLTAGNIADIYIYWGRTDGGTTASYEYTIMLPNTLQGAFSTNINVGYGFSNYYYVCFASNAAGTAWAPSSTNFSMPQPQGGYAYANGLRGSAFLSTPDNDTPFNLTGSDYQVSYSRVFTGSKVNTILSLAENPANNVIANQNIENFNMPGGDHFITAFSGAFFPTVNGAYRFNGSGDDRTQFYIDLDGDNVFESNETEDPYSYDNGFDFNKTLVANQEYRVMFLFQEHGGGENYWFSYTVPGQGNVRVNPADGAQLGQWRYATGTVPGSPIVTNKPVSLLTTNSATLNATLGAIGANGWSVDVYAYWGRTNGLNVATNWETSAFVGTFHSYTGTISLAVSDLALTSEYYCAFFVTNTYTNIWAQPSMYFQTVGPVTATNGSVTSVTQTNATLGAGLSVGGSGVLKIYWGLNDGDTNAAAWQNTNSFGEVLIGSYSTTVAVRAGAPYFYRVYATNAMGEDWADATATFATPVPAVSLSVSPVLSGFSPTNIAGCEAWYDASTLALSDGAAVTAWADSTTNARNLVAWEGTPNFKANAINGLPAVNFRNESLQMAVNNPYFSKDVYVVFRSDSGTSGFGSDWSAPIGVKDADDNNRMWMMENNNDRFWDQELPAAVSRNGVVITSANNFDMGDVNTGQYMVLKVTSGPNNGTQVREMIVGSRTDAWNGGQYDTAEIIAYSRQLSTAEENRLGQYLAAKYGLSTAYTLFDEMSGQSRVVASLSNPSVSNVTVNFSFAGVAVKDTDYSSSDISIVIPAGSLSSNITLTGIDDAMQEEDKAITVGILSLGNATNGAPATVTNTVTSDDPEITNGSGATGVTSNSVTLNGVLTMGDNATVKVFWGDNNGVTTASDWDNTNVVGTVSEDVAFTSSLTGLLANKTYFYRCYATNGSLLAEDWADSTASFTTLAPTVAINDVVVTEGDSGDVNATFTVTVSTLSATDVSVTATAANGTATAAGGDYTATNAVVTIPAGQPGAQFTVKVLGDAAFENPDELFYVNLTSPSGCTIADPQGAGTIRDDDAAVYLGDWRNWVQITFSGYGGTSTLTNWPALVRLSTNTIPTLDYDAFASITGGDLRFASADRTRVLNFEIEKWNTNGESTAWVQVPELPPGGTTIWAYWNNPGETALPYYATNGITWGDGFASVWHMNEVNAADASRRGHNGSGNAGVSQTNGVIGSANNFNRAANGYINVPSSVDFQQTSNFTLSAWIYDTGTYYNNERGIIGDYNTPGFMLRLYHDKLGFWDEDWNENSGSVSAGRWHLVVATINGTGAGAGRYYVDGAVSGSAFAFGNSISGYGNLEIGDGGGSWDNKWDGGIDEVRLESVGRSADWIRASYSNQMIGSTFNAYSPIWGVPLIAVVNGVTNIGTNWAYVTAQLTSTGGVPTTVTLYWGENNGGTTPGNWGNTQAIALAVGSVPVDHSTQLTSIKDATLYYYAYAASNAYGVSWAGTSFYTYGRPVLNNGIGVVPGVGFATLNGSMASTGGTPAIVHTYWGDVDGDTNRESWGNVITNGIKAVGAFSTNTPPALVFGKQYYYRVYATNYYGDAWAPASVTFAPVNPLGSAGGAVCSGGTVTNYTLNGTNFTAHIFTNSGTLTVESGGRVEVLVVAGGGGGGGTIGGGGGAGGLIYSNGLLLATGTNAVVVGAGGAGNPQAWTQGSDGSNSSFGASLVAFGGGGGGGWNSGAGRTGGSGGGGSQGGAGASGTTGQGKAGGNSGGDPSGGGGGAGTAGTNGAGALCGNGGAGLAYDLSGATNWYAGGGGGGAGNSGTSRGLGGIGGGGDGSPINSGIAASNGVAGTGGGGGGGSWSPNSVSGNGGSGIVIVRCAAASAAAIANLAASNVTQTSATFYAAMNATAAVYNVSLFWGAIDATNNAGAWSNTSWIGSFTNVPATSLTFEVTSGLTPGTAYYYAFMASNAVTNVWAQPSTVFYTMGPPIMNNDGGATSGIGVATMRGTLVFTGGAPVTVYTCWGDNDGGTNQGDWDYIYTNGPSTAGAFSNIVSNLVYGVRYYYRTYGTNANGGAWAAGTTNFTTLPPTRQETYLNYDVGGTKPTGIGIVGNAGDQWNQSIGGAGWKACSAFALGTLIDVGGTTIPGAALVVAENGNPAGDAAGVANGRGPTARPAPFDFSLGDGAGGGILSWSVSGLSGATLYSVYVFWGYDATVGGFASVNGSVSQAFTYAAATALPVEGRDYRLFSNVIATGGVIAVSAPAVDSNAGISGFQILRTVTAPSITNSSATLVSSNAATLNATLSCAGAVYDVYACWGTLNGGTNASLWTDSAYVGTCTNELSTNITYAASGLIPNTAYLFTFRATNAAEQIWATNVQSLLTTGPLGVDNYTGAQNLSAGATRLWGRVYSETADVVRVFWGPVDCGTDMSAWAHTNVLTSVVAGPFSTTANELLYGLRYYYRCYASNANSTAWAPSSATFLTMPPLAILATGGNVTNLALGGTNYTMHVFTNSDTFKVLVTGLVDTLVVGGGGPGGPSGMAGGGGGGGAGGLLFSNAMPVIVSNYSITVGDGGGCPVGTDASAQGTNGSQSVFGPLTALGGGRGGKSNFGMTPGNGGSGGGAHSDAAGTVGQGTAGPPRQGYNGGTGTGGGGGQWTGGGGGGAGAVGGTGVAVGGVGGNGLDYSSVFGTGVGVSGWFAGGGGGNRQGSVDVAAGGAGGGGAGGTTALNGVPGTPGTGGGGGAAGSGRNAGIGGSGTVIVRYFYNASGVGVTNIGTTFVTNSSVTVRGGLLSSNAVFDVFVHYGPADAGTGTWANTAFVGSYTNVESTNITKSITGLFRDTDYYWTFRASNAATNMWAQPSLQFHTTMGPCGTVYVFQ